MKINETWMNNLIEQINERSEELKTVALANKLHKELKSKSLNQVLQDHLPASDDNVLQEDAIKMETSISDMYGALKETITDAQVEARLNKALDGRNTQKQGTYLVNLLHCFAAANVVAFPDNQRWQALHNKEEYTQNDVKELMNLVLETIHRNAGILARQEFKVMESTLGHLSKETVTKQINSGSDYAKAYAAAMYITQRQTDEDTEHHWLEAAMLGLNAAQNVESSRLLAEFHFGRNYLEEQKPRLEELMSKLETIARTMFTLISKLLLQSSALAIRSGRAFLVAYSTFMILTELAVEGPILLVIAFAFVGTCCFVAYTQQEAVKHVLQICDGVKSMVRKIISCFRGNDSSVSGCSIAIVNKIANPVQNRKRNITV